MGEIYPRGQEACSSTWGAGGVQADVELVGIAVGAPKQALQAAHLVLLEGLIQVAAHQPHRTGLDHLPAGQQSSVLAVKNIQLITKQLSWAC